MKKRPHYFVFLLLLFIGTALTTHAQGTVSINRPMNDEFKSISKGRSIALSNTALAVGTGITTVSLFKSNTIETAGAALAVYGLVMGPSTGNFYAEDYPRGVIGMGVRTVGLFLMEDATSEIFGRQFANTLTIDDKDVSLTDTKILIGEALVVGSIIYNVISVKASVEEFNNENRRFSLNVTPTVINNKVAPMLTANISL